MDRKKALIFPKSHRRNWRSKDPLCRLLTDWFGKDLGRKEIDARTPGPVPIDEAIQTAFERKMSPEKLLLDAIREKWDQIREQSWPDGTFPLYIKNNVLFVKAPNSCSMMELNMEASKTAQKIEKILGEEFRLKIRYFC